MAFQYDFEVRLYLAPLFTGYGPWSLILLFVPRLFFLKIFMNNLYLSLTYFRGATTT